MPARGPAWLRLSLVLAGIFCMGLGTWRSFPTKSASGAEVPALRAVLFDLSAGTTRLRPAHAIWARRRLRDEALAAQIAGEDLAIATFAADVRFLGVAEPQVWLDRLAGQGGQVLDLTIARRSSVGSELDSGLAVLEGALTSARRPAATLVIYAADDFSGADPASRLARLAALGVQVSQEPLPPAKLIDFAVESIELPKDIEVGSALVGRVRLALSSGGKSRKALVAGYQFQLALLQQVGPGRVQERIIDLELPAVIEQGLGYTHWDVRLELGPAKDGLTRLVVRAHLKGASAVDFQDAIPENDQRSADCRAGDTKLVAAVAKAEDLPKLRAWLSNEELQGLHFSFLEPSGLSAQLGKMDLILSFNLGPADLPGELIAEFVRSGGSWFTCGGWGALPGWAPARLSRTEASLGDLLPLSLAPEERGPRDVILLVDGSGSMAGEPFARVQRAAAELVLAAPAKDDLSLRFFSVGLREPIDLSPEDGNATETLERLFASRVPRGSTEILASLDQLVAERSRSSRPALTILLTDGRDDISHDVFRRGAQIAEALTQGESRFVVVAAGAKADKNFLGHLVPAGNELLESGDLGDLAELFQREVFSDQVRNGQIDVQVANEGGLLGTESLLDAWGTSQDVWPRHQRYFRCALQPGADVLWNSEALAEPLLGWWGVGGGLVAAWASSTQAGWAPEFESAEVLFAPLWRMMARASSDERRPSLTSESGRLHLTEVPIEWPAQVRAEVHALIWGAGSQAIMRDIVLSSSTLWPSAAFPGSDPRERRSGPIPRELSAGVAGSALHVQLYDGISGEYLGQSGLQLPYSSEFEALGFRKWHPPDSSPIGDIGLGRARRLDSDPHAWVFLALGIAALTAAALLGALQRGGSGPDGLKRRLGY
ncbi:MAG: hypothetical protein ACI8X5_000423 [Planctomycetota bacterium]|jgi:uncharacterized protein YegL